MGVFLSKRLRDALGLIACAILAGAWLAGCRGSTASGLDETKGAMAVVLTQAESTSELAIIDLERMREVERIRLRSRCLSIDGDGQQRIIATAQCGGVGPDADSAVGVIEIGDAATPRYVELGVPNPIDIAVSQGMALVVHGFEQAEGTVASQVSLSATGAKGSGLEQPRPIHVAVGAGRPEAFGGRIVLPATWGPAGEPGNLRWLVPRDGAFESLDSSLVADAATIVASPSALQADALVIVRDDRAGQWRIERHSDSERQATKVLPVPEKGYFAGCVFGGRVAVADADGLDPADPGRRILVLDARTLDEVGRIALDGTPGAMRGWGDKLVVADAQRGALLVYEPGSMTPARSLPVAGLDSGSADVVVFE